MYGLTNRAGTAGHGAGGRLPPFDLRKESSYYFNPASGIYELNNQPVALDVIAPNTRASVATFFDASGVLQEASANTTRVSRDPVTGRMGALIEEGRTNSQRNPWLVGAVPGVIGQGGALPSRWTFFNAGGLTRTVGNIVTVNGVRCLPLRFTGVPAVTFMVLVFEEGNGVAASAGQVWSHSMFLARSAGTMNNVTVVRNGIRFIGGAGNNVSEIVPLSETLTRYTGATGTAGTGVTNAVGSVELNFGNTTSEVDITLLIGLPDLEQGPYATSPILPPVGTIAASTRLSDIPIFGGSAFANMWNPLEGTAYFEYSYLAAGISNQCAYSFDNGTGNETLVNASATPNIDRVLSNAGGVSQANFGNFNYAPGQVVRRAVAVRLNDAATCANGGAVATDTSYIMPAPTQLAIGRAGYFGGHLGGHVFAAAYVRRRVPNNVLPRIKA